MADEPVTNSKRHVKNPETFRERALKAAEAPTKSPRGTRLKAISAQVTKPVVSPLGSFLRRLAGVQPFKFMLHVLRWVGLIIVPVYLRNSWRELRLVNWPSRKQSRQLTFAVLVFAVIFGALIAIVDYGLDKLFKNILLK